MSENNSDLGAFLAGFVIGGLIGAATAIILAPQSGEETRQRLASKSQELRSLSSERAAHLKDTAGSYTQDYRQRATSILENTRGRVQETGSRLQEQARIVLDAGKKKTDSNYVEDASSPANNGGGDADAPANE
ncbi:MAG: hypothetical protein Kow0080_11350 [Candidatus Promineifilaceae bacterium]